MREACQTVPFCLCLFSFARDKCFLLFQATLTILDKLDIETENPTEEEVAQRFGWEDAYHRDALSLWQRTKPKMYSLFDEPHSSSCARVSE